MEDGPIIDLGKVNVFSPAKRSNDFIDIPFIRTAMKKPFLPKGKKHKASFVGRTDLHSLRRDIVSQLGGLDDFFIKSMGFNQKKDKKFYRDTMLSSHIVLCPRSYGANTFRFFEAMELGVVPFLIGDTDSRPFKDFIDWNEMSFYSNSLDEVVEVVKSTDKKKLKSMGRNAYKCWRDNLSQGNWCKFVFDELNQL